MKRSISIISFSPIYRDGRVLRQIKYLSPYYDLIVIGYGHPHPSWTDIPNIKYFPIQENRTRTMKDRLVDTILSLLSYIFPFFHEKWYWRRGGFSQALQIAINSGCDAFHANEWEALPVAAEASRKNKSFVVFDAHEFSPLMYENDWKWKIFYAHHIDYLLRKYAGQIDYSLTVGFNISKRYQKEYGIKPIVLLNAPDRHPILDREINQNDIRLIHHGSAMRDRCLEKMIETLALCDPRYRLDFMLIEHTSGYLRQLRELADRIAPDRIEFREPVAPDKVIETIANYDMGFYLLEPSSYNNQMALPNKFFDFIAAGLAVLIGPSPEMAEMVQSYGFGCVSPSFKPEDSADLLNRLTPEEILTFRRAAKQASRIINAENELKKLKDLYNELLTSPVPSHL